MMRHCWPNIAFVDTETVTLDVGADVLWEIGVILRDRDKPRESEWRWQVRPNVNKLSDFSRLDFEERFVVPDGAEAVCWPPTTKDITGPDYGFVMTHRSVVDQIRTLTHRRHIVGAVPDFDTWRMRFYVERWLAEGRGGPMPWHYHLIDVEGLAVGWLLGIEQGRELERKAQLSLGMDKPVRGALEAEGRPVWMAEDGSWKSDELYRTVGIDPAKYDRHTALGDSRLNRDVFDKVTA